MATNTKAAIMHAGALLQQGCLVDERYEIRDLISCGLRSAVYTCTHLEIPDQIFAIKILNPEFRYDSVAVSRFQNEIIASYGVNHLHVIRAFELLDEGDHLAFTMEWLTGGNLKDLINEESPLPIPEVITMLAQIAGGLQAIHDAGIMHRNLKPENILLTDEVDIRIADFGIAKITDKLLHRVRHNEEDCFEVSFDPRPDLYSFGLLAYHLITGQSIVRADNPFDAAARRLTADMEVPSQYRSDCPQKLDEIVVRALSADPEHRYHEVAEIFDDLRTLSSISSKRIDIRESVRARTESFEFSMNSEDDEAGQLEELFKPSSLPKIESGEPDNRRFKKLRRTDTQILKTLNDYLPAIIPKSNVPEHSPEMAALLQRVIDSASSLQLPATEKYGLTNEAKIVSNLRMERPGVSGRAWRKTLGLVSFAALFIAVWQAFTGAPSKSPEVQLAMKQAPQAIFQVEERSLFDKSNVSRLNTHELTFLLEMLFNHSQQNGKRIHPEIEALMLAALAEASTREEAITASMYERYTRNAHPVLRARAIQFLIGSTLSSTDMGIDILAVALRDSDYLVRGFAAKALAKVDSPSTLELLLEHSRKERHPVVNKILSQNITTIDSRNDEVLKGRRRV